MGRKDKKSRAVFIDRDGTLIRERNYLNKINEVKLLSGAIEALKVLKDSGFKLILVTNQSGIARGYLTVGKLKLIHAHLIKILKNKGARLDAIYFCPHGPDSECLCRKPNTGMALKAQKKFNIDLKRSYAVGDHVRDFELGRRMGGKGVFVLTGHGRQELKKNTPERKRIKPGLIFRNFLSAARFIVKDGAASR